MLRTLLRHARRFWVAIAIALAVLLVTLVTVDLGPALRARAERAGSGWLDRPMHIGRLGIQLGRGRFVVEDLRVDGLTADARPWLVAKQVAVSLTWRALIDREVLLDSIEMTDWRMVVESFPGGRHNWPRLTGPPRPPSTRPRPVVTTLQSVRASRGEFVFDDHAARWGVVAPNLDVTVGKGTVYGGKAQFHGGTVHFAGFLPMWANMSATFSIDGGRVLLDRVDLLTDGAASVLTGDVNLGQWPDMVFSVSSQVQFPRMREIFFPRETFSLSGQGAFTGTFRLFRGGRQLTGSFASPEAGLNRFRFQQLAGSLEWVTDRFEVTDASARFMNGDSRFRYRMAPLGRPGERGKAELDVQYRDVDLQLLSGFAELRGIQFAGLANGQNRLAWPLGAFRERSGSGDVAVRPPPGVVPMTRVLPADAVAAAVERANAETPHDPRTPQAPVGIAATLRYTFAGPRIVIDQGTFATSESYIAFAGETTSGEQSRLPFHVTSRNWQESDRLLAGLMTAFGNPTRTIPVDGAGEFDGVMVGAFRRPRIEGHLNGDAMRAFDVTWGQIAGDVVIENAYATVAGVSVRTPSSELDIDGRFSLGFPRRDGGEQLNARVTVRNRPVRDLLRAFDVDRFALSGFVSGEFRVYGPYTRPLGYGTLRVDGAEAFGEPFSTASAQVRFEGNGVRLDGVEIQKGAGRLTGAAYLGWNGSYSFNADGRGLPLEALELAAADAWPRVTGLFDVTASGSATFADPRYDVKLSGREVRLGDAPVGQVTGRLAVREEALTYEMELASDVLAVSSTGRFSLDAKRDADLSFRVADTTLDPYLRLVRPGLGGVTDAVASGTVRVIGPLADRSALRIDADVERLEFRLLDYALRNQGPVVGRMAGNTFELESLRLIGEDTALEVGGSVDLAREALSFQLNGAANLAVLQGVFPDLRSSGRADLVALVGGTVSRPQVSGQATLSAGRLRHFSFPHALEEMSGQISFDAGGVQLDEVTGQLGGGPVAFAGRVGVANYALSDYDLTLTGENLQLRYPVGTRSTIDVNLALQGPADSPVLSGTVLVDQATWTGGLGGSGVFGLGGDAPADAESQAGSATVLPAAGGVTLPIRYDVRVVAPSTLRLDDEDTRIVASADLDVRGTFSRPLLFGRAEIERGEVRFEGRRYLVTRGNLDFTNPTRVEPFFDIEAETRVRAPNQTYQVQLRLTGTTQRLQPNFTSDPPLPSLDILALLFSDGRLGRDVELASLRQPNDREQRLLEARATRALTGALTEEVGEVVEETFGVDTFQITPLLTDPSQLSSQISVNPSARITIGKRISDRVYLTYARSLSSTARDELVLLEFDQSDTLSWVLSQNEDRTYALEMRKRHTF